MNTKSVTNGFSKYFGQLVILFLITFSEACGQKAFDQHLSDLYKHTVPLVKADTLSDISPYMVLDTRSEDEFAVSHLQGAHFIDYKTFNRNDVESIPKETPILVYCTVGYRSERVGEKLIELGFENVTNLYGGICDWKNKGNDVVNENDQVTDSVHTYNFRWSHWFTEGIKVY